MQDFETSAAIRGRPLCNVMFADDIDLLGGMGVAKKNCNNLLKDKRKLLLVTAWKTSSDKSKILISSIKLRPSTNI